MGEKMRTYHNPWIPVRAYELLAAEQGCILDVGGGAAPYCRSKHVIDIQPFDAERLRQNAWGEPRSGETEDQRLKTEDGETLDVRRETLDVFTYQGLKSNVQGLRSSPFWRPEDYTQMDLCAGERWPFGDKEFDLGLSSHCLEDLRDPVQVVREMARVCKRVLVICPSRLFEQMRGVDHPNYSGMMHHPWLVYEEGGVLCFRRKTQLVEFPGNHLVCPVGQKLKTKYGCFCYYSDQPEAKEVVFFEAPDDAAELGSFVREQKDLRAKMEKNAKWRSWRRWVWYLRQKYGYAV